MARRKYTFENKLNFDGIGPDLFMSQYGKEGKSSQDWGALGWGQSEIYQEHRN